MARLTDELRRMVAREQRGLCFYCGLRLHDDQTFEHIVARRHGGDDRFANVRAVAHAACNVLVGTLPPAIKWALADVGHALGSDAFFVLAGQLRTLANAHDAALPGRVRRPKRPPPAVHRANVASLVARLPEELRTPLAA